MKNKSDIKLVLIGGGSYGWTYRFITDIACLPELHGTHVVLHDIDPKPLEPVKKLCDIISNELKADLHIETTTKLESALPHADFVGLTISTGGSKADAYDFSIPEKYGIRQTIADTVGPGGWSRALRNIPVLVDIIQKVEKYAPNAWFMNYSNPMSVLTRVIQKISNLKSVGLCHELQGLFMHLAAFLGIENWEEDILVKMAGINHLIWITEMKINGNDGLEMLKNYYKQFPDFDRLIHNNIPEDLIFSGGVNPKQKIKMNFLMNTGYLPAAGDPHIAEFFPQFLKSNDSAKKWGLDGDVHTFAHQRGYEKRKQKVFDLLNGKSPLWLKHSHEHASRIISALSGKSEILTPVNVANIGQIDNLPREVVVETQAYVNALGIHPVPVGKLPDILIQYLMQHIPVQEMIVEAGLTGNKDLAIQALSADPLVQDIDFARKMAKDFFEHFKEYLIQFQ